MIFKSNFCEPDRGIWQVRDTADYVWCGEKLEQRRLCIADPAFAPRLQILYNWTHIRSDTAAEEIL